MSAPASRAEAGTCCTPSCPLPADPERIPPLAISGTTAAPPLERPALPRSEPGPALPSQLVGSGHRDGFRRRLDAAVKRGLIYNLLAHFHALLWRAMAI